MIELACIGDGAYIRHSGAMLHSALQHCDGRPVRAHLLHSNPVSDFDRDCVNRLARQCGASIELHRIAERDIADLPEGYFARSVWLRVFLPELLPALSRVLYLDSDLIVTDSIAPLWDTDLDARPIAAVTNPFYPFMPDHPARVGIARAQDYFNSGVLLMDLAHMRRIGLSEKIRDFARRYPGADFPDQDALNDIFRDSWLHLHPRWNVQSPYFELPTSQLPVPARFAREAVDSPAVVHFIGPFKPWQYLCRHPLRAVYFEHARQTAWGAPAIEGRTPENLLLRLLPLSLIDAWFAYKRKWRRRAIRLLRKLGVRRD